MSTLILSSMDTFSNFLDILSFFTPVILLIGLIVFPFKYTKLNKAAKVIGFFMLVALVNTVIMTIYSSMYENNLVFINIYSFIELIALMLYLYFSNNIKRLNWGAFVYCAVILLNLYEFVFTDFSNEVTYQCYSKPLNTLVLFVHFIFIILKNVENGIQNIDTKFSNLLLLYLAVNCIVNLPLNILVNYNDTLIFVVWIINCVNVIILYSSLVWYIFKAKPQIIEKVSSHTLDL